MINRIFSENSESKITSLALIQQTLTDTYSRVKFLSELSEMFETKMGLRQEDGLPSLLFNCMLEKVIRE